MSDIESISEFHILGTDGSKIISSHSKYPTTGSRYEELYIQCLDYRNKLEVTGFREYKNFVIWQFNNEWYLSEQIDRILKLKVFT